MELYKVDLTDIYYKNNIRIKKDITMKKIIRLTESDLHHIVKNTVRRILKENNEVMMIDAILEDYKADDIAQSMGFNNPQEAAACYFKEISYDCENSMGQMPKYNRFIQEIPEINGSLYYDYVANYYFVVLNQ